MDHFIFPAKEADDRLFAHAIRYKLITFLGSDLSDFEDLTRDLRNMILTHCMIDWRQNLDCDLE
jgi:hypothetical protein